MTDDEAICLLTEDTRHLLEQRAGSSVVMPKYIYDYPRSSHAPAVRQLLELRLIEPVPSTDSHTYVFTAQGWRVIEALRELRAATNRLRRGPR